MVIVLVGLTSFMVYKRSFKYQWINTYKVYNEFDLKKQFQKKSETIFLHRKMILDSLELEIKYLYTNLNEGDKSLFTDFELKKKRYLAKKHQFDEDNIELEKQYNEQILTQLNQYLVDYSKENDIEMLLGADGKGTIIYADDKYDVTEDVVRYVNQKFHNVK